MTSDTASQIAYLTRVLKAPTLRDSAERLAERARADSWTHQEIPRRLLQATRATRATRGAANRIRAAGFTARKMIEDFDFDHQRSVKRDHILHLAASIRPVRVSLPAIRPGTTSLAVTAALIVVGAAVPPQVCWRSPASNPAWTPGNCATLATWCDAASSKLG